MIKCNPAAEVKQDVGRRMPHVRLLSGWGCCPVVQGREVVGEDLAQIARTANLIRGLGRSYGDGSLPAREHDIVANASRADRFLDFDADTGVLRAEAGASLEHLNAVFMKQGWSVPVSPGTQFVTLGGMVAADVHGKNHHRNGCFGEHVRGLTLHVADGTVVECSPTTHPDLFWATVGGMGLTGHILEVECVLQRIPTPWIWQESERIANLDAMVAGLKAASYEWPMTVGWLDCLARGRFLGRGILMKGRWAELDEAPRHAPPTLRRSRVPFQLPEFVLGRWSMKAFIDA